MRKMKDIDRKRDLMKNYIQYEAYHAEIIKIDI